MTKSKGQVLVELALVLPLLLVFTFAVIDYGRAMYTRNLLVQAARTGARVAAVTPSSQISPESVDLLSSSSKPATEIRNQLGSVTAGTIIYQLEIRDDSNQTVAVPVRGSKIQITLTRQDFLMITPFRSMLKLLPGASTQQSDAITISGSSSMQYEL